MSLLTRTAKDSPTDANPREADRLASENARLTAEVERLSESLRAMARGWAEADELLGREQDRVDEAIGENAELRRLLDDASTLLLPILPAGMYADDPMPAYGEPWAAVAGDRYDLPALIPVGATELAAVA